MKKWIAAAVAFVFMFSAAAGCGKKGDGGMDYIDSSINRAGSRLAQDEFFTLTNDFAAFPISFVYGDVFHRGLGAFGEQSRKTDKIRGGEETVITLLHKDAKLKAEVKAALYPEHGAYEYTVSFSAAGKSNTAVLKDLNAADMLISGASPVLKGIGGDHASLYAPYAYNLDEADVSFVSDSGRPSHQAFPYYNLETDKGGAVMALGWPGSWSAEFVSDKSGNTRYTARGTNGFSGYIRAGETIRTPLMALLRYGQRNEDLATNLWRKWYLDCNIPSDRAGGEQIVQPHTYMLLAFDSGKPNSDGSVSEDPATSYTSMSKLYNNNIRLDYRWIDAGWYTDSDYERIDVEWNRTGSWNLDKTKWPNQSLREVNDWAKERGTNTLMWFEPERIFVSDLAKLQTNFGFMTDWMLPSDGGGEFVADYSNPQVVAYLTKRVTDVMEENGIDMYREDFNCNPAAAWKTGDFLRGDGRRGVTENLYLQGHLQFWDNIIAYCKSKDKCGFIDSCASGGGRNDLESMRRGVPLNRSDNDRNTVSRRISVSESLFKWLPYTGAVMHDSASGPFGTAAMETMDDYSLRGSYLPAFVVYFCDQNGILDYDKFRQGIAEWESVNPFYYDDFYLLSQPTPEHSGTGWTSWMFFDGASQEGFVQVFRKENEADKNYTVKFRGLDDDTVYTLTDFDGANTVAAIKGKDLKKGLQIRLENPRSACMLSIKKAV